MLSLQSKYYSQANSLYEFDNRLSKKRLKEQFESLNNVHTWFIIPLLGISIPLMTGLMDPTHFAYPGILVHLILFIAIAEIIYKGNMFFLYKIRLKSDEINTPYARIVMTYFMVNIVYSGIISLASLSTWNLYITREAPFAKPVIITTLVIIICVLFINNLYEIYYLRAEKAASVERMQLLEKAKLQAELEALNSQIDPHFLYNALTSLSYLIQKKPWEADNHNARLASLYRYVLKNKCVHFVSLQEEMDFCQEYFKVQQVRFGDGIALQVVPGHEDLGHLKVPPLSVQTLIENALKHNRFSENEPLVVQVFITNNEVLVSNKIQAHTYPDKKSGTGLKNLNQRLLLLTNEALKIERFKSHFNVTVPAIAC